MLRQTVSLLRRKQRKSHKSEWYWFGNCRSMDTFFANEWGKDSRIAVAAPKLALEWDYNKNPTHLHPAVIAVSAVEPYWWHCGACGTSYLMSPEKRALRDGRCPTCLRNEMATSRNAAERALDDTKIVHNHTEQHEEDQTKEMPGSAQQAQPEQPLSASSSDGIELTLLPGETNRRLRTTTSISATRQYIPLYRK